MLPQNTELGRVEGVEVYDYLDGPVFFLAENDLGVQFLVYWCGVTETHGMEWLYLAITTNRLNELKRAEIDLFKAFLNHESDIYFVTTSGKGDTVKHLWNVEMHKKILPPPEFYIEHVALWED